MDFLLSPSLSLHAQKSGCKFTVPPLDGSLTLQEIYDFHYTNNPDHPVFVYSNVNGDLKYLTYTEVVPAAHRAARIVAKIAKIDLNASSATFSSIAIVASAGELQLHMVLQIFWLTSEQTVSPTSRLWLVCFALGLLLFQSRPAIQLPRWHISFPNQGHPTFFSAWRIQSAN